MDESAKNSPCKECRDGDDGVSLHTEVEHLRQHLAERDSHIVAVEAEFIKSTARASDLEEQVTTWREKYERLYDSHKRVQKLNQVLEDKLLQMVDKMKGEKSQLTKDVATLSVRLAEAKHNCSMLQKENERYKNDMNLAIQLLQCKPDNFVAQKLDSLPVDTQARVSQYVMSKTTKAPGSAQSANGKEADTFDTSEYEFNISASLMTKILEDSIQDTVSKHCDTCTCNKSQNKPFCYNESYYTVATQTHVSGEMKNSLCLSCNTDIKSIQSNMSIRSSSPGIKLINDKSTNHIASGSMYIIPREQSISESYKAVKDNINEKNDLNELSNGKDSLKSDQNTLKTYVVHSEIVIEPHDNKHTKKVLPLEPTVHHKLCDRTKTSISSKKSSVHLGDEELLMKDNLSCKESKLKCENFLDDHVSMRKNSQSSMGAVSRTSLKSTASANKSNTQVGPGPRFCHLRMQAGSKNILLDNAQPDVPPVLYKHQSRCNDELIFKDDSMDNFLDVNNKQEVTKTDNVSNVVVESTLIDVHVDNNNKEINVTSENTSINPVLLNVSSSPLQPLKTHNFSNSTESNNNNNKSLTFENQQNTVENDNLLKDLNNIQNNNVASIGDGLEKPDILTPTDNHDVKIFNFDRYEQSKVASQYNRHLRKNDMSQFHSIENTRISKDFSPQNDLLNLEKKLEATPKSLPPIVNVYPNLTQTHLKANEKKVSTNEQSTSSLSSDDSAAILQKQQLLRVAEWVEKNLEQQNSFKDPLDDEINFNTRASKKDSRLSRLNETLHEIALNMPHPVSKYSKPFSRELQNTWVHAISNHSNDDKPVKIETHCGKISGNIVKETIFPVEECVDSTKINNDNIKNGTPTKEYDVTKALLEDSFRSDRDRAITADELARMEYNVKKFLLSGPHWATPDVVGRSRRTSSKTETDV